MSDLFDKSIDDVLTLYKKRIKGIIAYYIGADEKKILGLFLKKDQATIRDFVNEGLGKDEVNELLRDMVKNNILYFEPTEATYYLQGSSYQWGKPRVHPQKRINMRSRTASREGWLLRASSLKNTRSGRGVSPLNSFSLSLIFHFHFDNFNVDK